MALLNAVQGVLSIILMIVLGYILRSKDWFDDKTSKLFSKLVVNISLPAYMIANIMGTYNREKLMQMKDGVIIPFIIMAVGYVLAKIVARLIKVAPNRAGTFCSMFALSNTIFVGLPVNLALFGDISLPYVLLYYIANTTMFWTFGVYGISTDGENNGKKLLSMENIKRIFSPPLVGFLVAVVLVLLGVKLPEFLMSTSKYIGNLTTPLSMMFIGIAMYSVKFKEIRLDKDMITLLLGRFVLAPLVAILVCRFVPLPDLMKKVFVIQAAMPAMTQTSIIAETYKADSKYAAVMVSITTIVSLVMIPFYMLLLNWIG